MKLQRTPQCTLMLGTMRGAKSIDLAFVFERFSQQHVIYLELSLRKNSLRLSSKLGTLMAIKQVSGVLRSSAFLIVGNSVFLQIIPAVHGSRKDTSLRHRKHLSPLSMLDLLPVPAQRTSPRSSIDSLDSP